MTNRRKQRNKHQTHQYNKRKFTHKNPSSGTTMPNQAKQTAKLLHKINFNKQNPEYPFILENC